MNMPTPDTLALIDHRLSAIEDSHNDLKDAIKDLTVAINKLAVIDERQVQSALVLDKLSNAVDKAHTRIDNQNAHIVSAVDAERKAREEQARMDAEVIKLIDRRVDALEKAEVENQRLRGWAFGAIGVLGLGVGAALLKIIGLTV